MGAILWRLLEIYLRSLTQKFKLKIRPMENLSTYEEPIKCIDDDKDIVKIRFGLVMECQKIKHYIKNGEFEV